MPTAFQCPFFRKEKGDEEKRVVCEGGIVRFPDRDARDLYVRGYCANLAGWERCSVAAALLDYYHRCEKSQKGDARQKDDAV